MSAASLSKQRFYTSMTNTFLGNVGKNIEGESGYTNLMSIKDKYFGEVLTLVNKKIEEQFDVEIRDEIYNKLYTFFESYLNETGTPFFYNTQIHKNLYDKIYTNAKDVSLFWKTKKLFYVKSEALYTSMKIEIDNVLINFDASKFEHQLSNEINVLEFILVSSKENNNKTILDIKVRNKESNAHKKLFEKWNLNSKEDVINKIRNKVENKEKFLESNINYYPNNINIEFVDIRKVINIYTSKNGLLDDIDIEIGISINNDKDIYNVEEYLDKSGLKVSYDTLKKAMCMYKKQNEIDYFIHKDANNFLKEQFNIYLYNYLFNDSSNIWTVERVEQINKMKDIAYMIIEYISKLEDELKNIWLKPKFVRKSNYVLTLEKLQNNISLIKEIINHPNFNLQIEEWKSLYPPCGKKKKWEEFKFAFTIDKNNIISDDGEEASLNLEYKNLPIDTKYFKDIEFKILNCFENLDKELDGIIIKSDNFQALNTIYSKYSEDIDLVYINPPFNTGKEFDYKDGFQDSTWLTIMENRLELTESLMKNTATIYVHLDHNADYLGRVLLNEKFGKETDINFRSECIWRYSWGMRTEKCWNRKHDTILVYSKSKEIKFNANDVLEERNLQEQSKDRLKYKGAMVTDKNNRKSELALPTTVFNIPQINAMSNENVNFITQKPEELLERIILASSNIGDRVMDYFTGSGTTIATAHKLGRKWIGVEQGDYIYDVVIPRMKKVLIGDTAGISEKIQWKGGGFFKYYELEQYEDTLRKCKYDSDKNIDMKLFYDSEKLLDALTIEEENAYLDFSKLYKDVDVAETLSNILGEKIKSINLENVEFEDGTRISLKKIKWENNKALKPLIWWGN